ncbi:MAG: LacI family DNA-binding transcriptional regulator [Inquilinaceae bacterium]
MKRTAKDVAILAGTSVSAVSRAFTPGSALSHEKRDRILKAAAELANAIKDSRSIGFVKSAAGTRFDALTTDIAAFAPVRVIGIADEQRDMIAEELPELSLVDMPGGDMEGSGPYQT